MRNVILNVTATGNWQTLGPTEGFPQGTMHVKIRTRTAVTFNYKYAGQTAYTTVPATTKEIISGRFEPGDIEVQAANGVVIEIDCSTQQVGGFQ